MELQNKFEEIINSIGAPNQWKVEECIELCLEEQIKLLQLCYDLINDNISADVIKKQIEELQIKLKELENESK